MHNVNQIKNEIYTDNEAAIVKVKFRYKGTEYETYINTIAWKIWPSNTELIEPDDTEVLDFLSRAEEVLDVEVVCDVYKYTKQRVKLIDALLESENCIVEMDGAKFTRYDKMLFMREILDEEEECEPEMVDINFVARSIMLSATPISFKSTTKELVY